MIPEYLTNWNLGEKAISNDKRIYFEKEAEGNGEKS